MRLFPFSVKPVINFCKTNGVKSVSSISPKYGRICISPQVQHKPSHYNKLPQLVQEQIKEQCIKYGTTIEECMENQESRQLYNINYFKDWADNYKYKGNNRYQKRLF